MLGKTNLDQFATGLVGTRSPYGAVRNAWDPARISGGSSSGSAVAVALGLVDIALGTDTAGSGRVPAALNGIVGVKPTRGAIPATGVVPACRTAGLRHRLRPHPGPGTPDGGGAGRPGRPRPARPRVPRALGAQPQPATTGAARGLRFRYLRSSRIWPTAGRTPSPRAVARLRLTGAEIVPIDIAPLLEAAALLYGGAFVAERYAAVGAHIRAHDRPDRHRPRPDRGADHPRRRDAHRGELLRRPRTPGLLAARAAEAMSGL